MRMKYLVHKRNVILTLWVRMTHSNRTNSTRNMCVSATSNFVVRGTKPSMDPSCNQIIRTNSTLLACGQCQMHCAELHVPYSCCCVTETCGCVKKKNVVEAPRFTHRQPIIPWIKTDPLSIHTMFCQKINIRDFPAALLRSRDCVLFVLKHLLHAIYTRRRYHSLLSSKLPLLSSSPRYNRQLNFYCRLGRKNWKKRYQRCGISFISRKCSLYSNKQSEERRKKTS